MVVFKQTIERVWIQFDGLKPGFAKQMKKIAKLRGLTDLAGKITLEIGLANVPF
jgi:hypothetical protein